LTALTAGLLMPASARAHSDFPVLIQVTHNTEGESATR
jgi:hypothetical protein